MREFIEGVVYLHNGQCVFDEDESHQDFEKIFKETPFSMETGDYKGITKQVIRLPDDSRIYADFSFITKRHEVVNVTAVLSDSDDNILRAFMLIFVTRCSSGGYCGSATVRPINIAFDRANIFLYDGIPRRHQIRRKFTEIVSVFDIEDWLYEAAFPMDESAYNLMRKNELNKCSLYPEERQYETTSISLLDVMQWVTGEEVTGEEKTPPFQPPPIEVKDEDIPIEDTMKEVDDDDAMDLL